jgi:hypothetical protein
VWWRVREHERVKVVAQRVADDNAVLEQLGHVLLRRSKVASFCLLPPPRPPPRLNDKLFVV